MFQSTPSDLRIQTQTTGISNLVRAVGDDHSVNMIMEVHGNTYRFVEIDKKLQAVSVLEIRKGRGPGETAMQGDFKSISENEVAALDLLQQKVVVYHKDDSGSWHLADEFIPEPVAGSNLRLIGYHHGAWYMVYNEPFSPEEQNLLHVHRYNVENATHERLASIRVPMNTLELRSLVYRGEPKILFRNNTIFFTWNIFPVVWTIDLADGKVNTVDLLIDPPASLLTERLSGFTNRAQGSRKTKTTAPYFHWTTIDSPNFIYSRLTESNRFEIMSYDLESGLQKRVMTLADGESVLAKRGGYLILVDRSDNESEYLVRRDFGR